MIGFKFRSFHKMMVYFDDIVRFKSHDPYIIMKNTYVKDMAGEDIYEYDIILHKEKNIRGVVGFSKLHSSFGYRFEEPEKVFFPFLSEDVGKEILVIGNIFENPDLTPLPNNKTYELISL